jgi:hypothetical protein
MKFHNGNDLIFSWYSSKKPLLPHNLKEWENDQIGSYFELFSKVPKILFGNKQ